MTTTLDGSQTLAPRRSSIGFTRRGPPESCIMARSTLQVTISPGVTELRPAARATSFWARVIMALYYLSSPNGDADDSRTDFLSRSRARPRLRRGDGARHRGMGAEGPRSRARGAARRARNGRSRGAVARAGRRRRARGARSLRRPSDAEPARRAAGERHAVSIDGRSFAAAQAFLLGCKKYWTRTIYPAVREEYQAGRKLEESVLYQYYCWLERHLQRFKYSGRYGLQPYHAQQRQRLEAELRDARIELAENPDYPDYYTRIDIHQHPGGVWSDPIAGFVYERGARSTTPLAGGRHRDLHDRLASVALEVFPMPSRVLDMGCGFGKSTRPFYETLKDAEVEGVDLSAPCLRLAARDAAAAGAKRVRFRQM